MSDIRNVLRKKILVLDGAMGTMIKGLRLEENDFINQKEFKKHQKGNYDLLNITRPDIIRKVHGEYLAAGANIIKTNTFNSNGISQLKYGLEDMVYELNYTGARLAREAIADFSDNPENMPRYVAGAIGPSPRRAIPNENCKNNNSKYIDFEALLYTYTEQIKGLIEGGVDILLIETVYDALNAKAALMAADTVLEEKGIEIPIIVSGTISDESGRILSGETIEAFSASMNNKRIIGIGFNCSFGFMELVPFIKQLSRLENRYISFYPNAGFPDAKGEYHLPLEEIRNVTKELVAGGFVNIIGGCCGTTPVHINEISKTVISILSR